MNNQTKTLQAPAAQSAANKLEVTFGTRTEIREVICDGIVKYGDNFLIRDSLGEGFRYCSEERMQKLIAKHGSIEAVGQNYQSRDGKKKLRKAQLTAKATEEAKAVASKK